MPGPSARSLSSQQRSTLARRLSELLEIRPELAPGKRSEYSHPRARRIGISGPPGAGKSSLIEAWSKIALEQGRRVGVLAVDPSSPISSGSLLGDRVRMDRIAAHPAFYMRSVPSRRLHDGLCPNAAALLDAFDELGFDDVILETVGVGQAEYNARALVDTFVLVVNPESGDIVQAMKAGVLEVADVLVVSKADLATSQRMAHDLEGVIALQTRRWRAPVIPLSTAKGWGLEEFDRAVSQHSSSLTPADERELAANRARYRLAGALFQSIEDELAGWPAARFDDPNHAASLLQSLLARYRKSPT